MQVINITYGAAGGPSPEDVAKLVAAADSVRVSIHTRTQRMPWLARLKACDARRGPYAPCVCCGRMTPCLMDPTMSGVVRPWCMWHGLKEDIPVNRAPGPGVRGGRWPSTEDADIAHGRRCRRLAGIARRRAATSRVA